MNEDKRRLVMRGETKYLEQRIDRVHAVGFIDDVYTKLVELDERMLTKKTIRIYDISTTTNLKIIERSFHYGESLRNLKWKRNSKIEFDGTVYKLDKCKGKNDQKPGSKELWEIRNPRNVEVLEFETNNRYRPKKQERHSTSKTNQRRREALRDLERDTIDESSKAEREYRQAMKREWQSLNKQGRYMTSREMEERIRRGERETVPKLIGETGSANSIGTTCLCYSRSTYRQPSPANVGAPHVT